MADNINLATFKLDTALLEKSLDTLQTTMFNLRKEQEGYNNLTRESQKAINAIIKDQLRLAAAGEESSQAYQDNAKALEELNEVQKQNYKNSQNVATNMSRVRQEVTATNTQLKAYMNSEAQQQSLMDSGNKALATQVTNINQARASNTELLRVRNQLNPTIAQEAKLITELNNKMNENNKFIKENASEYEQQKIGIGSYKESIKEAFTELGGFNGQLGNAQKALGILSPAFGSLKEEAASAIAQIRGTQTATEGMTRAQVAAATVTNVVSGSLKLLKIALIGTGIGAIVVLLGGLVAYLTTTQSGIDKLTAITRPLQAVFSGLMKVLVGLGEAFVDTFSNPKKAMMDLVNFVKQNVINRFIALGDIIQGIFELDFAKVGESAIQAATGVDDLTGKVGRAAQQTAAYLADAAKKGAEIDSLTKQMAKSQLEYNAAQIAFNDAVDEQLLISKDTSKSFEERGAAAREIIRLSEENGKKEAAILQLELKRLKIKQDLKGVENLTNEDKQEELDLLEKIDAAEDKGRDARLEQSRVLAGLEKERAAASKKATDDRIAQAKAAQEAAIKAMQTELDFYIASQGDRKRSMADQLEIDKETMRQSLAINKAEYDAKKLTKREYEFANLEITNEFQRKQVDATIANAEIEFELFQLNNQRKIDENQFFSDELYNQELERINRIAEAEAAAQTLKFEKGLISAEEYALAIRQVDENQRIANESADAERDTAKKEQEAANIALEDELNAARFDYDLALQLERYDRQYAAEKAAAEKAGADMVKFEEVQAAKRKKIEQAVMNNKLELTSSTLGNIASILGESSDAGKAFAIAQTTIDTYLGAQKAYVSQLIPGDPSSVPRAVIAAGAAVVAGLANVKKIVSVDTKKTGQDKPKYAKGVIGLSGLGTGTSDSIDANLSAGESVITARATQMFPQLLSDINQAGGGVGLDGMVSSNAMVQNDVSNGANNLAELIAEAVAIGAARGTEAGSAKGISDLSDNRQILANAKF